MEEQKKIYLSLENYEYLKPDIVVIEGFEKRLVGVEEIDIILLKYKNIVLEKKMNKRDQDTITLLQAKNNTAINQPVKIRKIEFKGKTYLALQPLNFYEEQAWRQQKQTSGVE